MNEGLRPRVVLLIGRDETSNAVYHALADVADVVSVIEEEPPSKVRMTRRRIKRLGLRRVLDQLLFITVAMPILRRSAARRLKAIRAASGINVEPIPDSTVERVSSINDPSVIEVLQRHQPDIVVINGTRIIAKRVLECVEAPFVNTHAGITPAYRGVHGGYWALAEGKPELAGVTVHYLDAGIDTGTVIAQDLIHPGPDDNFSTYPTLQLAAGLPLLKKAVLGTHREGLQKAEPLSSASRLYYHPGLSQYLAHRVRGGVR